MTGGLEDGEGVTAEVDGVASIQTFPRIGEVIGCERVNATYALGLLVQGLEKWLIGGAYLQAQAPVVKNKLVTEVVVYMSVGDNQMFGL